MSLITLLFKNMPVEPKLRKGLYYVTVFMPLCIVCRQKQQVHLCSKTLRKNVKSCTIGLQLYYKLILFFKVFNHNTDLES